MEILENGLQTHSGATPLFSIRTELLATSQSCCSVDADAWCKRAPTYTGSRLQRVRLLRALDYNKQGTIFLKKSTFLIDIYVENFRL